MGWWIQSDGWGVADRGTDFVCELPGSGIDVPDVIVHVCNDDGKGFCFFAAGRGSAGYHAFIGGYGGRIG